MSLLHVARVGLLPALVVLAVGATTAHAGEVDEVALTELLAGEDGTPPEEPGRFEFDGVTLRPGSALVEYSLLGHAPLNIVFEPVGSPAYASTASFAIYFSDDEGTDASVSAARAAAMDAVVQRVRAGDDGSWTFADAAEGEVADADRPRSVEELATGGSLPAAHRTLIGFGFLLLAASIVFLPRVFRSTWRTLESLPPAARSGFAVVFGVAAVIRAFLVPHLVVTMYMGYLLTAKALTFDSLFRYGVGAQTLWSAALFVGPDDHATVLALHTALGIASLGMLAAILRRTGLRPGSVVLGTALLGTSPMLLWSETSDSLTVPVLFWTYGAVLLARDFLDGGPRRDLVGAVVLLAMAAHTRPEHVLFGPLLFVVLVLPGYPAATSIVGRWKAWAGGAAGYAALVAPQVARSMVQRERMLPHSLRDVIMESPELLSTRNALIDPDLVPLAVLPLAVLSLLVCRRAGGRRFRLSALLLGLVWLTFYYVDLSSASLPRLHVVLLIPCLVVMADLAGDLWTWRPSLGGRTRLAAALGPALAVACIAAIAAGEPRTAAWLWQDTNEQEEEMLVREVVEALRGQQAVLVRYGGQDGDPLVHQHFPDYLFNRADPATYPVSIRDYLDTGVDWDGPVFFYQGMRCYSVARAPAEPAPDTFFHPSCARMWSETMLEPVFERDVPNRGDLALFYYPAQPTFHVGLYRVHPRANPE